MTHDTASIGGLVTIAPIVFAERLAGTPLEQVTQHCLDHLALTHPDAYLAKVCRDYVGLLNDLLFRDPESDAKALISAGVNAVSACKCRRSFPEFTATTRWWVACSLPPATSRFLAMYTVSGLQILQRTRIRAARQHQSGGRQCASGHHSRHTTGPEQRRDDRCSIHAASTQQRDRKEIDDLLLAVTAA